MSPSEITLSDCLEVFFRIGVGGLRNLRVNAQEILNREDA
jgi:hypothetical protein